MIIYPSIDKLLDKVPSKYSLCTISAKRALELQEKQNPILSHYESPKYIGQALEEIMDGALTVDAQSVTE